MFKFKWPLRLPGKMKGDADVMQELLNLFLDKEYMRELPPLRLIQGTVLPESMFAPGKVMKIRTLVLPWIVDGIRPHGAAGSDPRPVWQNKLADRRHSLFLERAKHIGAVEVQMHTSMDWGTPGGDKTTAVEYKYNAADGSVEVVRVMTREEARARYGDRFTEWENGASSAKVIDDMSNGYHAKVKFTKEV